MTMNCYVFLLIMISRIFTRKIQQLISNFIRIINILLRCICFIFIRICFIFIRICFIFIWFIHLFLVHSLVQLVSLVSCSFTCFFNNQLFSFVCPLQQPTFFSPAKLKTWFSTSKLKTWFSTFKLKTWFTTSKESINYVNQINIISIEMDQVKLLNACVLIQKAVFESMRTCSIYWVCNEHVYAFVFFWVLIRNF